MAGPHTASPFAQHRAPSPAACAKAVAGLSALHGEVQRDLAPPPTLHGDASSCGQMPQVLDGLVATILSQNTTQKNSTAAMANLMATFERDYAAMLRAGPERIAQAIWQGGLGNVKGRVIASILTQLEASEHGLSLEHLRALSDDDAKALLLSFEGVGVKTASCVLLFALGRESFAVDTHVHRIVRRLGWVPDSATRDQAHAHLEVRIPAALKYPLHVLLVEHGKCCPECAPHGRPQRPPVGACPLAPVRKKRPRQAAPTQG